MKKTILLILFLYSILIPLQIKAKTPTKEETMKIIDDIENIQVDDDIRIKSTEIQNNTIILNIEKDTKEEQVKVYYGWINTTLNIYGGSILINNNQVMYL